MRISKHPARKAICVTAIFVLIVAAVAAAFALQWMPMYNDLPLRDSLAGSVDALYSGVSSFVYGIAPSRVDAKTGGTSYNLSGVSMTFHGRKTLLEKELARNPVDTVYMEVTYEMFTADQTFEGVEGDVYILPRLGSFKEKLAYARAHIRPEDLETAFSLNIFLTGRYWKDVLVDHQAVDRIYTDNGFIPFTHKNIELSPEKAAEKHDSGTVRLDFKEENVRLFKENIELCQKHGAEVVIVFLPLSDGFIWMNTGWEALDTKFKAIAEENGCDYLNFNLLKSRYALFNDRDSFFDENHFCEKGARAFSEAFGDVIAARSVGEDVSDRFYASYAEMKADSPYAKMEG